MEKQQDHGLAGNHDQIPSLGFSHVQVVQEKTPAVPKTRAPRRRERKQVPSTIIVIAPNGMRFEGLDLRSALAVARELGSCN